MLHDSQIRRFISFILMVNIEDTFGAKSYPGYLRTFRYTCEFSSPNDRGSLSHKIPEAHMVRLSDEISNKHPQTA